MPRAHDARLRTLSRPPAFDLVVIAASLGGREALAELLGPLPPTFPVPILVAQHVSPQSRGYVAALLAPHTRLRVAYAAHGERPQGGTVYLAPPDRHLVLGPDGRCELLAGPPVNFARPAADPLFVSAAAGCGARALGVVLSGRLHDGAAGAAAVRRAGGVVLVQEPSTCRAPGMPNAAIERAPAHFALPPHALGEAIVALVTVPGMAPLLGLCARSVA